MQHSNHLGSELSSMSGIHMTACRFGGAYFGYASKNNDLAFLI